MSWRMDTEEASWFELAAQFNLALLSAKHTTDPADFGALGCGNMAVDWDTSEISYSRNQKKAVGGTFQGLDGFTTRAAYPRCCLELALRPGVQHCTVETELNLERVLPMAPKLTPLPLLFRTDSGLCSLKIVQEVGHAATLSREIALIINKHGNPLMLPEYELEGGRRHCRRA